MSLDIKPSSDRNLTTELARVGRIIDEVNALPAVRYLVDKAGAKLYKIIVKGAPDDEQSTNDRLFMAMQTLAEELLKIFPNPEIEPVASTKASDWFGLANNKD